MEIPQVQQASAVLQRPLYMRWALFALGLVVGGVAGVLLTVAAHARSPAPEVVPRAGVLHGWSVVRDDETLVCESPSIFVAARQIECP